MPEEEKTNIENLVIHLEEYIKTQKELSTLFIAEKTSQITASLVSFMIIFLLFFFTIVFASLALAYVISNCYGSNSIGFISVALFYLLMGIILFISRKKILETPMINSMINKYFQNDSDEKN